MSYYDHAMDDCVELVRQIKVICESTSTPECKKAKRVLTRIRNYKGMLWSYPKEEGEK